MPAALKELFLAALRHPPSDRWRFLVSACGGDTSLRRDVAELLSYHGHSGELFESDDTDGASAPISLDLPERLGGYVIEGLVGVGGIGIVYKARRLDAGGASGEFLALKVLRSPSPSPDSRRRFRREAEVLARIDHPGIARLVDAGVFELSGTTLPYLVTELVDGCSLRAWAERPPPTGVMLDLVRRIAEALAYAHSLGIIHRDLKPENVVVASDGRPRILDFGLARLTEPGPDGGSLVTRVGQVVGTIPYMSPEQAQASPEPVDERTDLYALGVIGYELLAGRLPIDVPADSLHRAIVAILTVEPTPLGQFNPACRGDAEYLFARLLAKKPADRYPSAAAVVADLERLGTGRALVRRPVSRESRRSRNRKLAAGAALAGIGLLGLLTADLVERTRPPELVPVNRAIAAAVLRHLAQAGILLHSGEGEPLVLAGLAQLDSAEARLSSLPGSLPLSNIYQALYFRQAEGHYFLGALRNDKEEFWNARALWERSWGQVNKPFAGAIIDSTMDGYGTVQDNSEDGPIGGMVLAHMALAGYERPLLHLNAAYGYSGSLWPQQKAGADSLPWIAVTEEQKNAIHGYCMCLNNRSSTLARIGFLEGDSAKVRAGLAGLREADERWPERHVPEPRGANLHNLGRAWRYWAIISGDASGLDSAEAAFRRALAYREAAQLPRGFAGTQFERARAMLDRPNPSVDQLERSLLQVRTGRRVLEPFGDGLESAEGRIVEAEVLVALAETGRRANLAPAESLLTEAISRLPVARFPLQHVEALRVQARAAACRARFGDPTGRQAAIDLLSQAIELISPIEEPFRRNRLGRQRDALIAARDRARDGATIARTSTGP